MANQGTHHTDHDEVMALLPWFVNQTLEEQKREAVLRHIDNCTDCQREINLLESLNETVQIDAQNNYSSHADVDMSFASVMNRIDAQSHSTNKVNSGPPLLQKKLSEFFRFATASPVPKWSAAALAGLLVATLGFQLFYGQSENDYSVLSSSDINGSSMRLSVELNTAVNQEQARANIQQKFEKIGQQVDIETKSDAEYIIIFRDAISVTELSKLVFELENNPQIDRVEVLP